MCTGILSVDFCFQVSRLFRSFSRWMCAVSLTRIQAVQVIFTLDVHWILVEYPGCSDRFHAGRALGFLFSSIQACQIVFTLDVRCISNENQAEQSIFTLDVHWIFVEYSGCSDHFHAGCAMDFCRVPRLLRSFARWVHLDSVEYPAGQIGFTLDVRWISVEYPGCSC